MNEKKLNQILANQMCIMSSLVSIGLFKLNSTEKIDLINKIKETNKIINKKGGKDGS